MPSAVASKSGPLAHDDLDNYDIGDLSDDPFRSPTPESKKRKDPPQQSGLGIDEEVSVQKRARVPNIKLDEDRLLGQSGIPTLRKRAETLKLKGKGHEFSDAARLLSFYQLWLDDLFPKAKFVDALGMVEKAGHKKKLTIARNGWINEGKPKSGGDDEDLEMRPLAEAEGQSNRPSTPTGRTAADDGLYDATPRRAPPTVPVMDGEPDDDDDLEALMAEAAGQSKAKPVQDDADDLDALIAEAEGQDTNGGQSGGGDDFAAEEAAMQEMDGLW